MNNELQNNLLHGSAEIARFTRDLETP